MPEFTYTVLHDAEKESWSFSLGDIKDPARLVYRAEEEILKELEQKGFALVDDEREYLESYVAIAVARNVPSGKVVEIGELQVQPVSETPPLPDEYMLINIVDGKMIRRNYNTDQSIGAIIADIRTLYKLGPNDHIMLYQVIDGARKEIKPTMLVGDLPNKEIHWEAKPYE